MGGKKLRDGERNTDRDPRVSGVEIEKSKDRNKIEFRREHIQFEWDLCVKK